MVIYTRELPYPHRVTFICCKYLKKMYSIYMKLSLPNLFSPKLMIYLENSNLPNACTAKNFFDGTRG